MLTRRQLLERSLLMSLAPAVPAFLTRTASAAEHEKDRRVLVVVQLDGGNDGLNTVIPYRDEHYSRLRPTLRIGADRQIKLNDELALHPSMKPAAKLFEDGQLSIIQGVGYPNPNRSHFESMAVWHSARLETRDHGQYGWLGRALDTVATADNGPQSVYSSAGSVPVALWGRRSASMVVKSKQELSLASPFGLLQPATLADGSSSELARYIAVSSHDAFATCERLSPLLADQRDEPTDSDANRLAGNLSVVSALIKAGVSSRVFYVSQGGYDTHAGQGYAHARLLREFSSAIKSFLDDLTASGLADRVLVLAFSEFGRRAAENASEGTDHGAAAPVFLAGSKLATRTHGPVPDLSNLKDGDIEMKIDFRQVYATILRHWLEIDPSAVLATPVEELPLFRA